MRGAFCILRESILNSENDAMPLDDWRAAVDQKLEVLTTEVQANTTVTKEVHELLNAVRGGMRVLGWLGGLAKWAVPFVALAAGIANLVHQLKGTK